MSLPSRPSAGRAAALAVVAALVGGCQLPPPPPERPTIQFDACAERLHDLCGHLLLYYSAHKKLPATLAELASSQSLPPVMLTCPVSNQPYVYDPAGRPVAGRQGRLVLHDPEPTHRGMRWGILVTTPTGGDLITANVVLVTEKELAAQGPGP